MQSKIIAMVCASYAHATTLEKARRSGMFEKPAHIVEQERMAAEKVKQEAERKRLDESTPVDPYPFVSSSEDGHGCSFAHDRTKKPISTDLSQWIDSGKVWTDRDFPGEEAIFWPDVPFEAKSLVAAQSDGIFWQRASEAWPERKLFGENGVTPSDTAQGDLGNCWLMAAISAVAEYPERIEDLFLNDGANALGKYCVNIYSLGVPHTVCVDDYLPFKRNEWTGYENLFYAQVGADEALWGPLIEKVLAKNVGNYWHLDTGINADGVSMLNGSPYDEVRHWDTRNGMTVDKFWDLIKSHDEDRSIMTVKSSPQTGGTFIENHSYVILKTLELESGERLVKLRNPWGVDTYSGKWHDSDSAWGADAANRDIPEADDGLFYTSIEEFYNSLESTFINYDTSDWHLGYFLKLDDPAQPNGRARQCGSECTRHKLTVTSDVDQEVWVGAHTYRYYSYADGEECPSHTSDYLLSKLGKTKSTSDNRRNMIFNNKTRTAQGWEAGDVWLPKMFLSAGESVEIEVELNLDRPGVTKDWSLTAWGVQGGVTVTHNGGLTSDSLPYQPKGGVALPVSTTEAPAQPKEDPVVSSSAKVPSFEIEIPSLDLETAEIAPSKKTEIPTFEIPVFETGTEPQGSTFTYTPEPMAQPESIPKAQAKVEEVIATSLELPDNFNPNLYEDDLEIDLDAMSLTEDGGVKKFVFTDGSGQKPAPGDRVSVSYEGMLEDYTVFDSNLGEEPFTFELGKGQVVAGWDIGIASMTLGEAAELTITSDYGYGDEGRGPIPGGATMIFTVELVGINDPVKEPVAAEPVQEPKQEPVAENQPEPEAKPQEQQQTSTELLQEPAAGYDILTADAGVQKKTIQPGQEGVKPKEGDVIVAHYIGKLLDGTIFDQSNDHGGPIQLKIGVGAVIPGWDIAIQSMELGEVAGLIVDPLYAYGDEGTDSVPADSTLLFLIQLAEIIETEPVEEEPQEKAEFEIEDLTGDQGVLKKKFEEGEAGRSPMPEDFVLVHYEGRLLHDGTLFDSSYQRGEPLAFPVGVGAVIPGWDIGLMSMEVGEKAQIVVNSEYGYGEEGRGPIPGGATMIFSIEFLDMWKPEPEVVKEEPVESRAEQQPAQAEPAKQEKTPEEPAVETVAEPVAEPVSEQKVQETVTEEPVAPKPVAKEEVAPEPITVEQAVPETEVEEELVQELDETPEPVEQASKPVERQVPQEAMPEPEPVAEETVEVVEEIEAAEPEPEESAPALLHEHVEGYEMLTADGGVQKKILDQGIEGKKPMQGDFIEAHYIGKLPDGTVFDTSEKRGKPIKVPIGVGKVVKGWDIALQEMNLGEVAGLIVTQEYGYGSRGKKGMVPPNSTMLFLVQLVGINGEQFFKEQEPVAPEQAVEAAAPEQEGGDKQEAKIEILTEDKGVLKAIFMPGSEDRKPQEGETVLVHYEGRLLQGGTLFDSSYKRGQPLAFPVGVGAVIPGWDIGIMSMNVGEKSQIVVNSDYGYGDEGRPGIIPGGATMVFNVELLDIIEEETVQESSAEAGAAEPEQTEELEQEQAAQQKEEEPEPAPQQQEEAAEQPSERIVRQILTQDRGVTKTVKSKGQKGVRPRRGDKVAVHYQGSLEDGTVFDSSFKRGIPLEFPVGKGRVIRGWDIGIMSMEVGEKAELTIQSDYGYGDKGRGKHIPGGATMIFQVELLEINGQGVDQYLVQHTEEELAAYKEQDKQIAEEEQALQEAVAEKPVTKEAQAPQTNEQEGSLQEELEPVEAEPQPLAPLELSEGFQALTDDGGVAKRVIKTGIKGFGPQPTQEIVVHYEGLKEDGTVFDSSYERKEAFIFGSRIGDVIPGWDIAIASMTLTEKIELIVRSDYAFGEAGSAPEIGAGENLRFIIELVGMSPRKSKGIQSLAEGFVMQRPFQAMQDTESDTSEAIRQKEEAAKKAQEEARKAAEEEARRAAEEEARKAAEEEAKRIAEEEARKAAEEEARKAAEEEARRIAEEHERLLAEEEARRKAYELEEQKRREEEQARRKALQERLKALEAAKQERLRLAAAAEAAKKKQEELQRQAEEAAAEAARLAEEEQLFEKFDGSKLTFTLDMKKITDSVESKLKDQDYLTDMGLAPVEPEAVQVQEPEPMPEPEPEVVEPVKESEPEPQPEPERPTYEMPLTRQELRRQQEIERLQKKQKEFKLLKIEDSLGGDLEGLFSIKERPTRATEEPQEIEIPDKFDLSTLTNLSLKSAEESRNALLDSLRQQAEQEREQEMKARLTDHLDSMDTESLISNLLSNSFSFGD